MLEGESLCRVCDDADCVCSVWVWNQRAATPSAFWPCDKFPEPIVRRAGNDKIEVLLSQDAAVRSFELLWWGP